MASTVWILDLGTWRSQMIAMAPKMPRGNRQGEYSWSILWDRLFWKQGSITQVWNIHEGFLEVMAPNQSLGQAKRRTEGRIYAYKLHGTVSLYSHDISFLGNKVFHSIQCTPWFLKKSIVNTLSQARVWWMTKSCIPKWPIILFSSIKKLSEVCDICSPLFYQACENANSAIGEDKAKEESKWGYARKQISLVGTANKWRGQEFAERG